MNASMHCVDNDVARRLCKTRSTSSCALFEARELERAMGVLVERRDEDARRVVCSLETREREELEDEELADGMRLVEEWVATCDLGNVRQL